MSRSTVGWMLLPAVIAAGLPGQAPAPPDGPFHTTFTLEPDGASWNIVMEDRGLDGAWRDFARYACVARRRLADFAIECQIEA